MIEYRDECVGCPPNMGCLFDACPYSNVPHFFCDKCGEEKEYDELRDVDDEDVCLDCCEELGLDWWDLRLIDR